MTTDALKRDLLNLGATTACARYFSDLFSSKSIDSFSFTPVQTAFYPDQEIAERVFRRLCTEIDGKNFKEFELRLIKTDSFHTDFFSKHAPKFTADKLTFSFCNLSEKEAPFLTEHVKNSGATQIILSDIPLGDQLPEIGKAVAANNVSDLSLSLYQPHTGICEFSESLKKTRLEKLSLSFFGLRPTEAQAVGENLPSSLKLLSLSNLLLNDSAENVANSVAKMENLYRINLMSGELKDAGLQKIMKSMPHSLNGLTVYKQPDVTDKSAISVLDFVSFKDVFTTSASMRSTGVSEEMQRKITDAANDSKRTLEALETAREKFNSPEGKRVREALDLAKTVSEIKAALRGAAEIGLLTEGLDKLKKVGGSLTAYELNEKDGLGRSVSGMAVEQRKAFELFDPRLLPDAKEMQKLFDALNAYGKRQLNARYGYPSYQQAKNEMMTAAVKKALAAKGHSK